MPDASPVRRQRSLPAILRVRFHVRHLGEHGGKGRNRGWRKAVRFALTENPISVHLSDQPQVPEFFRLVCEAAADDAPVELTEWQEVTYTLAPRTRRPRQTK